MTVHRIARAELDTQLRQIVRDGEAIDAITTDGDEYVVTTTDRIETRPTHALRLGVPPFVNLGVAPLAKWDSPADGQVTA